MRGAGLVTVKYLGTEENTADLFTKILDRQPFEKHRKTVLNAAANDGVPSARDKKAMGAWPRTLGDLPPRGPTTLTFCA